MLVVPVGVQEMLKIVVLVDLENEGSHLSIQPSKCPVKQLDNVTKGQ